MADTLILAGDVGATKTVLGLFSTDHGRPTLLSQQTFRSSAYSGVAAMAREFLQGRDRAKIACFGVAGPVIENSAQVTNLSWTLQAKTLATDLRLQSVLLINDLVATGYGVTTLGEEDFLALNPGHAVAGANAAVIAAGTGLGECTLYWDGRGYVPLPAEAGHADFAPYDETSLELVRHLRRQYGYASVEHVLSGPGILNIYRFLCATGAAPETLEIAEQIRTGDAAAVITQAALTGTCALCARTLDAFVSAYGAEAGNLALRSLALGGVYLGGGIVCKIIRWLQGGLFMQAFVNKDRQAAMLAQIPVRVILNESAPLFGAVNYLLQRA
ncbi:MAG TPA: glucokinase [Terriglobales bacterium]|nr:glucokinase [Terriglobales bacterium]